MATSRAHKPRQKKETPEEEMLRLYEPFRFLEAQHWGDYLVVAPDGRYVVGSREVDAIEEAYAKFGNGLNIFKVGEVVSGNLPWSREL